MGTFPNAIIRIAFETLKPLLGLASFAFNPFSMAYGLFSLTAYLGIRRLGRGDARTAALTVALAATGLWAGIFLSTKTLQWPSPARLYDPMQAGGFPLVAFLYPNPAMGGDVPPPAQWLPFFLDYAFWLLVATLAARRLGRMPGRGGAVARGIVFVAGVICSLHGLGDTLLRFD